MASFDQWKKASRVEKARKALATKRLLWLHRPIWIHAHATEDRQCDCCESRHAHRVEELQHLDVLVNRVTGERWVRSHLSPIGQLEFDALCAEAERIDCPIRCSYKQLRVILDTTHRIIGVFGGERAGKSTVEAEWFFDRVLERGGIGALFWWVSKTRKMALQIGLKKLIKGERSDRWAPGIIPKALVVSYPRSAMHDVPLVLIDGTEIHFHHASSPDGDNLKGQPPVAVVLDEACTVDHEANWTQLKMRITDASGQVLAATTPVIGHYLQREIREAGKSYEELEAMPPEEAANERTAWISLSQPDNPWLDAASIKDNIDGFHGDELKIRAHIYGEWVAIGRQLWRHFEEHIHLREGPWRDVGGWGLTNITPTAAGRFFRGTESDLNMIGGQDFNVDPHNLVLVQVAVPKGMDQSNPKNWILFVLDHVQSAGTITQFAEFLACGQAANMRKLDPAYFSKLAIACDPSGAHRNPHKVHGLRGASTLASEMRRRGFDCRPCNVTPAGEAQLPPQIDSISLLHKLMADRVKAPDGTEWARLIIHGSRCPELVYSLKTQLANARGGIEKRSATRSDVLSGPTDALRYLAWAVPGQGLEYQTRKPSNNLRTDQTRKPRTNLRTAA